MAVARYHDLRRQIDALVAENEELKQLVQLLRENHELKYVLRTQYHESTSLPDYEAPRIDAEDSRRRPAFQESSAWSPSHSGPQASLRLNIQGRPRPDLAIQGGQHPPPPPPPPPSPGRGGTVALGQPLPTLRMALQQDKQYPFRYRAISPPSSPAHLALCANSPASGRLSSGSFQSSTLRGYCFECPSPWHPHAPPLSPTITGSDPNFSSPIESGTFSSLDWSLANSQYLPRGPATLEYGPQAPAGGAQPLLAASGPPSPLVFDFSPRNLSTPFPGPALFPAAPENMAAAAAPSLSWDSRTFLLPNVAPGGPPPTRLRTVPQVPPHLQPIILRNPDPFVLQPPPPSRAAMAPLLPAPLALQPFAGGPPVSLQKPPDVRPKERRGSAKPLDTAAVMKINEAKIKDTSGQERILGEIAFQLDRRILAILFPNRNRLYGYTVQNVPEKVAKGGTDPFQQLSPEESAAILERYQAVMERLRPLGYDPNVHPRQMEVMVNNFGILRERPEGQEEELNDIRYLRNLIKDTAPPDLRNTCILFLSCLHQLSQEDGKPLFIW